MPPARRALILLPYTVIPSIINALPLGPVLCFHFLELGSCSPNSNFEELKIKGHKILHYHSQFIHVSRLLVFVFDPSLTTWSGIPGYSNAGAAGGRRRARATAPSTTAER